MRRSASHVRPEDVDNRPSLWVRQEPILARLTDWIGTLADLGFSASGQDDGAAVAATADLRRRIRVVRIRSRANRSSIPYPES